MASRNAARKKLERILRRVEPKLRRELERAFAELRASIAVEELERAITSGSAFAVHDLAKSLPRRLQRALSLVQTAFKAGTDVGKATLGVKIAKRFSAVDPFSVKAAKDAAAAFVTSVTAETRKAIRTLIVKSQQQGIAPRVIAREIRPLIGLTSKQAAAVINRRTVLARQGVSLTDTAAVVGRYGTQLVNRRAEMIARTETMQAANTGQQAVWESAEKMGFIDARSQKKWLVSPEDRRCEFCTEMLDPDLSIVQLDQPFHTPLGTMETPPMHPNCRCTIGLIPVAARSAA